jgi:predicted ATPase/DNA-binding CsgD family transcriptional regulator
MAESEKAVVSAASGMWAPLTSLVGRAADVAEVARLINDYRLVTVTGPGGVGKTRLTVEVARRVGDRFPDGVWFIGLDAVTDLSQVPAEVMSVLGVQQASGRPPLDVLGEVLAPRRLLLVLDGCEHVLTAVADLCAVLLSSADEVSVLATSREHLGIGGETRYRLSTLELPGSGDPAEVGRSAAGALFVERARQADPQFNLSPQDAPLVARVVTRLDGMPLGIELAAARVEALGMAGLADRIDDALRLLAGGDLLAEARRSLAAVANWSYRLLAEPEQLVFRRLAVFPGPFTLEAVEAVAGPDAGPIVLRLVDCSLLVPPRTGPDRRSRYTMLQTLRTYALARLREAGEEREAMAALAAFAWSVAEQATTGLETSDRELEALRWLDGEEPTLSGALTWALDHDPDHALRLASALARWLRLRGRLAEAHRWLSAAARTSLDAPGDACAQLWLGRMASNVIGSAGAIDHFTAAIDACRDREPSRYLVEALANGRAVARVNLGDFPGALDDARRALEAARELRDPAVEFLALTTLSLTACYAGDAAGGLDWARQAEEYLPSDAPGHIARWCRYILALVLTEFGELDRARRVCAAGLAMARQVDDRFYSVPLLAVMAHIDRRAGDLVATAAHLREATGMSSLAGDRTGLRHRIDDCAYYCAATGRWAEALTLWAAYAADLERHGEPSGPALDDRSAEYMRRIERELEPAELRRAEERGARMPFSAAVELVVMLTAPAEPKAPDAGAGTLLSPRERELVTLVAQGQTNAQIAARLHISVRTVASHLDRIRDKTGHRRRADLTRLALEQSLV